MGTTCSVEDHDLCCSSSLAEQWCYCERMCDAENVCSHECVCKSRSYLITGIVFLSIGAVFLLLALYGRLTAQSCFYRWFAGWILTTPAVAILLLGMMWTIVGATYRPPSHGETQCAANLWSWVLALVTGIIFCLICTFVVLLTLTRCRNRI